MKQTAVEWLYEELILEGINVPKVFYDKAKEMEKEQIVNAVDSWVVNGNLKGEQYYNETFKSE
jgi:hypothetical protein